MNHAGFAKGATSDPHFGAGVVGRELPLLQRGGVVLLTMVDFGENTVRLSATAHRPGVHVFALHGGERCIEAPKVGEHIHPGEVAIRGVFDLGGERERAGRVLQ